MLRLNTRDPGFAEAFKRLVSDRRESGDDLARDVEVIISDVKNRGDAALADMTARWDGHNLANDADWQFSAVKPLTRCSPICAPRWNWPPRAFAPSTKSSFLQTATRPTNRACAWARSGARSMLQVFTCRVAVPLTHRPC